MLIIKCLNILSQTRKTEMETPSEKWHAMPCQTPCSDPGIVKGQTVLLGEDCWVIALKILLKH